jgi:site-specific DNA-methyltransferase (adenine-specific)
MHHILIGDCREQLLQLDDASVDSVVTDPPYELGFMGKGWDSAGVSFEADTWRAILRVLKPGGHLVAFGGTRTFHRIACAIEDAGFEVRDCLSWLQGQGFPKGLNIPKALIETWHKESASLAVQCSPPVRLNSAAGGASTVVALARILPEGALVLLTETGGVVASHALTDTWRSVLAEANIDSNTISSSKPSLVDALKEASKYITATASATTIDERTWNSLIGPSTSQSITPLRSSRPDGGPWPAITVEGCFSDTPASSSVIPIVTALGSATWNPVVEWRGWDLALKPSWEPIVLARKPLVGTVAANVLAHGTGGLNVDGCRVGTDVVGWGGGGGRGAGDVSTWNGDTCGLVAGEARPAVGRWPANVVLDEEAAALLDAMSGVLKNGGQNATSARGSQSFSHGGYEGGDPTRFAGDSGGASRFFYTAKTSAKEREAGLDHLPKHNAAELTDRTEGSDGLSSPRAGAGRTSKGRANVHPTVKPIALMRWLVRLVTPPGGLVLDPFTGSGSTGCAAVLEGMHFLGCELTPEYVPIAEARIAHWQGAA